MNFDEEVAARKAMVKSSHPLMQGPPKQATVLIPVEQAICQIEEAIDCYQGRIESLQAELKILRDE